MLFISHRLPLLFFFFFFFFNDTATTEIYTLSLHDALPISRQLGPYATSARITRIPKKRLTACPSAGDRKSTRLNSSHGSISYAVFCLKKTKRQPNTLILCKLTRTLTK